MNRERAIWNAMLRRCTNETASDYPRYGGRGITVCERWRNFHSFYADMGERPEGCSLDRIDNDGNYEPGNCRWATWIEQANNKRTNRVVTYRERQMSVADAARLAGAGVSRESAHSRLKRGWSVEDAVETPHLFQREPETRKIIRPE